MIRLKLSNFSKLQGAKTETEISKIIGISRSQLWRIKKKKSQVGQEFITKFFKAFPNQCFDTYFFVDGVDLMEQQKTKNF